MEKIGKLIENGETGLVKDKKYWDNVYESEEDLFPLPKAEVLLHHFSKQAQKLLDITSKKFQMDKDNRWIIEAMCLYFSKDERFKQVNILNKSSFKKGIMMVGNCGTGKSLISRTMHRMFLRVPKREFGYASAIDIVLAYDQLGDAGIVKYFRGEWRIDDVGTEEIGKFYGKEVEVLKTVFEKRYNLFIETGKRTFINTNLDPIAMEKRYGDRFDSRKDEMFNIMAVSGKDRRK